MSDTIKYHHADYEKRIHVCGKPVFSKTQNNTENNKTKMNQDNSQINAKEIDTIVIPMVTVLFTSNIFSTKLLTDFNMVKIFSDESNVSYIEIKNTEIIQAKNVLVQILFDSEVKISYINCLEGKISHNKVIMIFGIILAVLLPILYVSSA